MKRYLKNAIKEVLDVHENVMGMSPTSSKLLAPFGIILYTVHYIRAAWRGAR